MYLRAYYDTTYLAFMKQDIEMTLYLLVTYLIAVSEIQTK
jgi:hypothetical protein